MSAGDPICLSVIGADGVPAGLDETDPGELARTEETARRWDITGYEDGDAERVDAAVAADIKDAASGAIRGETMLLHATPSLRARIESLGYRPGETPANPVSWLVDELEAARSILSAETPRAEHAYAEGLADGLNRRDEDEDFSTELDQADDMKTSEREASPRAPGGGQ